MAADTDDSDARATFEDVDWDALDTGPTDLPARTIAQAGVLLAWLAAVVYDYLVIPGRPIVPGWALDAVDWLFVLVLIAAFFNVVVPLYTNARMTAYYWRQFRKNPAAVASLAFLIVMFAVGLIGPLLFEPPSLSFGDAYRPPVGLTAEPRGEPVTGTWEHPLGTDHNGRDMLKLVVFGMRVSMEVGLISMVVAITLGTVVGTTAANFGGTVDELLMRYVDLQQSFPAFILLLLLIYLYGSELILIILLYGFLSWESTARLVRSEALQRSEEAYVRAAEAAGASRAWVIRRHLIPNVSSTVITAATLSIPLFILGEASLSFLGFSDPNVFSWGKVIAGGRDDLRTAPWIATIPGLFLFCTVLAFNFVGDALRDAIDPRQEH